MEAMRWELLALGVVAWHVERVEVEVTRPLMMMSDHLRRL
jgi:hypothetical protein